jgi:organic hydroperoxide reductase OsmC/OhrA
MQPLSHKYTVLASSLALTEPVVLESKGLESILSAAPSEFGGPGDLWSPETLFTASVADCFILSFKAVATASKFNWEEISCTVEANLDRQEKTTRFISMLIKPKIRIPTSETEEKARKILDKAKSNCLVSNSISASIVLVSEVLTSPRKPV